VTRFISCRECGGTGYAHGHERYSECQEPATDAWIEPGNSDYGERVFPLCAQHMRLYQEEAE